jgi:glycerophosphoryl diester phosphodiesterase
MSVGADGVELDVFAVPDGRLVVTHDKPVPPAHAYPSLDDVLALAAPENFWFDIEAKSAEGFAPEPGVYARLLLDAIRRAPLSRRLIVRSFDHAILRAFHAIAPEIPLAALIESSVTADWTTLATNAGASIISPHYSVVTRERIDRAHAAGTKVSVWTVNRPEDWARLAEMGVDTIITNDPGAAVRYFR